MIDSKQKHTKKDLEFQKLLNEFDRKLEKGLKEVIGEFSKSGKKPKQEDISKKLNEVYSIAWNDFIEKNGLETLKIDTTGKLKDSKLIKVSQMLKDTYEANLNDGVGEVRQSLSSILKDIREDEQIDTFQLEKLFNFLVDLKDRTNDKKYGDELESVMNDINKFFSHKSKRADLERDVLDKIEMLDELHNLNVKNSEHYSESILGMILNMPTKLEMVAIQLTSKLTFEKKGEGFTSIKDSEKKKLVMETRLAMLGIAAVSIACCAVAAVLLSEVLVGVAVGGAVGTAVSTFVTTQAPALLALAGVTMPAATAELVVGSIAAAGATTGLVGIAAMGRMDLQNSAIHAAVAKNKGLTDHLHKITEKFEVIAEHISEQKEKSVER